MSQARTAPAPDLGRRAAAEIRAELGRQDISRAELCRRMGVERMWLSNRLSGDTPLRVDDLEQIGTALGVPVADLLPPVSDPDLGLRRVTGGAA